MEQSKLSSAIAKLKIAYPYFFKELRTEELAGMISMYQEYLSEYNETTLSNAVKLIIRKNKFMPSIQELVDECERFKTYKKNLILEKMRVDGYFKKCEFGELDSIQEFRNYEKVLMWSEKDIIPSWLLEDMRAYGYVDEICLIKNSNNKLLGGVR